MSTCSNLIAQTNQHPSQRRNPIGAAEGVTTFVDYYNENDLTFALKGVSRGEEWREWRQALNKDVYAKTDGYIPLISGAAKKISKVAHYEVTESKNLKFEDFISRSAFDMFSAVMYGTSAQTTDSYKADEVDIEFVKASQRAFDLTGQVLSNPLEKLFASDIYSNFKVSMDKTYSIGKSRTNFYINDAVKLKEAESIDSGLETNGCPVTATKSMIQNLVNRGTLKEEDLAEMGPVLVMAGVDTTAYVMSWLFLNLAENVDVQSKLAAELKKTLKGEDITSAEQLDALPYLKACIRESHRLNPSTPIMTKKLDKDIDVQSGDGSAYHVKAGQRISLNLRGYPMDPKYLESPNEYRPERFLKDSVQARKGTPAEVIDHPAFADPFGRGKRRCLGSSVAINEIEILTARLFQDYELTLVDPKAMWQPKMKLMLKADPYPDMILTPRS